MQSYVGWATTMGSAKSSHLELSLPVPTGLPDDEILLVTPQLESGSRELTPESLHTQTCGCAGLCEIRS